MAKKLRIYTKTACHPCRLTKKSFEKANVEYEERNIDINRSFVQEVKDLGFTSVPVVVFAETDDYGMLQAGIVKFSGFDLDKIRQIIAEINKT